MNKKIGLLIVLLLVLFLFLCEFEVFNENFSRKFVNLKIFARQWLVSLSDYDKMASIEARFHRRKQILVENCAFYKTQPSPNLTNKFCNGHYLYENANIYFCNAPKTGSTSLHTLLYDVFDKNSTSQRSKIEEVTRNFNKRRFHFDNFQTVNQLKSLKFIIAREPLERIFSCWYNKLSGLINPRDGRNWTGMQKVWGPTINKVVPISSTLTGLSGYGSLIGLPAYQEQRTDNLATFEQFLRFVDSNFTEGRNSYNFRKRNAVDHWLPISSLCFPCAINYDFVASTETLTEDLHFILAQTNPNEDEKLFWIKKVENSSGEKSKDVMTRLLQELPRSLVEKVLEKYESDYKLFGFKMEKELDKYFLK